ncbi:hypothetical protein [Rickettsia sibirica]|uniref:hypothetical protein n=1 Tax=Rickettsia sibirica TaxID=35793 RepID=UPI00030D7B36|nr:hypothetical protein [Rickettsia sibirica]
MKENAVAIKINAGKRILTDKIYENTRHELLINFDYETTLKKLKYLLTVTIWRFALPKVYKFYPI